MSEKNETTRRMVTQITTDFPKTQDSQALALAHGSALIIGARYRDRKGYIINGANWILDAADIRENRIRLVPERQTLPLCWESTRENFDATFELLPNVQMSHPEDKP